jgi:hypothetical protein
MYHSITILVGRIRLLDGWRYTGNMGRKRAEHGTDTAGTTGCLYDLAGKLCGNPIRARGYCEKHYKVLNRRGAFRAAPLTLQPATTTDQVDRNLGHLERARQALDAHAEKLVEHLLTAAEVAARKGDSKPAEWGLLHTRTVEPVFMGGGGKAAGAHEGQGIRVLIGVQLGQQPAGTPLASPATSTLETPGALSLEMPAGNFAPAKVGGSPATIEAELIPA